MNDYTQKDALSIPLEVIQEEVSGQKYVYIIDKTSGDAAIAQKSYITLGESAIDNVIITSGIKEGDEIVVKGYRDLSNGSKVNSIPLTEKTDE